MRDFPNSSGVLNKTKEKKTEQSPDYYGNFTLDEDLVRYLVNEIKSGNKLPKISLGAWLRDGKYGKFISISPSKMQEKTTFSKPQGGFNKPYSKPAGKTFEDDSDLPF